MATTVTISHNGTPLHVSGTFCRGYADSYDEPGQGDSFEIHSVTDSGVDVMHLHDLDEIEGLALEAYRDLQAFEACEAADRQREERRFAFGVLA